MSLGLLIPSELAKDPKLESGGTRSEGEGEEVLMVWKAISTGALSNGIRTDMTVPWPNTLEREIVPPMR